MGPGPDNQSREFARAKTIVFRLLKYRSRAEGEIVEKLTRKEIAPAVIGDTVRYFRELGLIDDRVFSRCWIVSRLKKPVGWTRIRRELKEKRVSDDIIRDECARASSDYDEEGALGMLARRRMRQYRRLAPAAARRRLYAYLIRRGFSSDLVYKTLRDTTP